MLNHGNNGMREHRSILLVFALILISAIHLFCQDVVVAELHNDIKQCHIESLKERLEHISLSDKEAFDLVSFAEKSAQNADGIAWLSAENKKSLWATMTVTFAGCTLGSLGQILFNSCIAFLPGKDDGIATRFAVFSILTAITSYLTYASYKQYEYGSCEEYTVHYLRALFQGHLNRYYQHRSKLKVCIEDKCFFS